jgi:hypothetical protein
MNWFKAPVKILVCDCKHEDQDKVYGKQQRVHNPCKGNASGDAAYRCTVCGKKRF